MKKVTFSRLSKEGNSQYVTVYLDGKDIGEIYKDDCMIEYGACSFLELHYGEDCLAGSETLANAKKRLQKLQKESES